MTIEYCLGTPRLDTPGLDTSDLGTLWLGNPGLGTLGLGTPNQGTPQARKAKGLVYWFPRTGYLSHRPPKLPDWAPRAP